VVTKLFRVSDPLELFGVDLLRAAPWRSLECVVGAESHRQIARPFHQVTTVSSPLTASDSSATRFHIHNSRSEAEALTSTCGLPGSRRRRPE